MLRPILPFVVVFCGLIGHAQTFTYVTNQQGIAIQSGSTEFGHGASFFDFNQDGWDDLTVGTAGQGIYLYVNNFGTYSLQQILGDAYNCTHVVWCDYDRDGDHDLLATNDGGPVMLFECTDDGELINVAAERGIPQENRRTFGASWGDYDRDGWPDLYICNYAFNATGGNWLLRNNAGNFENTTSIAGVGAGLKPSFQSTWIDINHDLWPDLYVVNDKYPTNNLFLNDGDGTFTDISLGSGADIAIDAMSNSIADIDHDGDLDIYISNNYQSNVLLRNNGDNTFTDIAAESGLSVGLFCWGNLWIDVDNNSSMEVFTTTDSPAQGNVNPIFRNNENGTWTQEQSLFATPNVTRSFSPNKGDMNNDGYPDIFQSNALSANGLWRNSGGSNNWFKLTLEGVVSNKDGIGCWIQYYFNGQSRSHYSLSGENYLGQNSQHLIFGFGTTTKVDSLLITWPSGWVDKYITILPSSDIHAIEGATFTPQISATSFVACEGETIVLFAPENGTYLWSNGSTEPSIEVTTSGFFSVTTTINGLTANSEAVECVIYPLPNPDPTVSNPTCFNASDGSISIEENLSVLWDDGNTQNERFNMAPGIFGFTATNSFNCSSYETVELVAPPTLLLNLGLVTPSCSGESDGAILLDAMGGTPGYSFVPTDLSNISAGSYSVLVTDSQGCTIEQTIELTEPEPISANLSLVQPTETESGSASVDVEGGTPPYVIFWSNGISGLVNNNLNPGIYTVSVLDSNGCIATENFTLSVPDFVEEMSHNCAFNSSLEQITCSHPFTFQLFDVSGRLILQSESLQNEPLSLIGLPIGVYLLCAEIDGDRKVFKAVID